jgi:hypothetical protein
VNAKAKGSRRERQARKILELAGYHVVKAGGSLGVFNLKEMTSPLSLPRLRTCEGQNYSRRSKRNGMSSGNQFLPGGTRAAADACRVGSFAGF